MRRLRWTMAGAAALCLLAGAGVARADQKLSSLLSQLYGGDGILLDTPLGIDHSPHFTQSSLQELSSLSDILTSSLGSFTFNSTVSSYTFDLELGVPVRTTESLGPIVSERATTIGARRLNVGYSYNRVGYKRFQGHPLDDYTIYFNHDDVNHDGILGPPGCDCAELDKIAVNMDIKLVEDIYSFYGTFGVLKNLDIGVAIPLIDVDLRAHAHAEVQRNHTDSINVHNFAIPPDLTLDPPEDFQDSSVHGSSFGIGDILLRGKYNFLRSGESWRPNLAAVGQVQFPTGDEYDLQGTGSWAGMFMFVVDHSYGPISPHLNLGYEIVGGHSDRDNLRYYVGFDTRLHPRLTGVIDLLGRWEPKGDGIGDNLLDGSIGAKFNVWRSLVLVSNFIVPINRNQGLRTNFIWALGIEYTFGGPE